MGVVWRMGAGDNFIPFFIFLKQLPVQNLTSSRILPLIYVFVLSSLNIVL